MENAGNSICETLDFKACPQTPLEARGFGARFCEHHLKNSIFLAHQPHFKLRFAVPDYDCNTNLVAFLNVNFFKKKKRIEIIIAVTSYRKGHFDQQQKESDGMTTE